MIYHILYTLGTMYFELEFIKDNGSNLWYKFKTNSFALPTSLQYLQGNCILMSSERKIRINDNAFKDNIVIQKNKDIYQLTTENNMRLVKSTKKKCPLKGRYYFRGECDLYIAHSNMMPNDIVLIYVSVSYLPREKYFSFIDLAEVRKVKTQKFQAFRMSREVMADFNQNRILDHKKYGGVESYIMKENVKRNLFILWLEKRLSLNFKRKLIIKN